ncbi:LysR family transcriptional regulator [Rahnella ecdela]|uniref:LysR family transcriptional regulator n=1 Tax=Rahnella ecdela TaxID=2816250 RepID=A0ABS6LBL8_9GAMM|nr:LysR family transcriptional regulator [Rahnella ecdela]MBU9843904.1 LysR family transcriptional regulator [Rahnella ecdela]
MQNKIELKLLKVINFLVMTGSVTKTAQMLNLTPGAISYSLKILRKMTGEHLFIRTHNGMKPDTTALELSQRYERFTASSESIGNTLKTKTRDELKFMTFSLIEMLLADSIFCLKNVEAGYRFVFLTYTPGIRDRINNLKNDRVDIDAGGSLPPDKQISRVKFLSSKVSLLAGIKNDSLPDSLTVDDLRHVRHAVWSEMMDYCAESISGSGEIATFLQNQDVAIISGSIVNMVAFCSNSQCVMLIPDVFIPIMTKRFPVKVLPLPAELDMQYDCYLHFKCKLIDDVGVAKFLEDLVKGMETYNKPASFPFQHKT